MFNKEWQLSTPSREDKFLEAQSLPSIRLSLPGPHLGVSVNEERKGRRGKERQTNPCAHKPQHDDISPTNRTWISRPSLFQAGSLHGDPAAPLSLSERPDPVNELFPQLCQLRTEDQGRTGWFGSCTQANWLSQQLQGSRDRMGPVSAGRSNADYRQLCAGEAWRGGQGHTLC